MTGTASCLVLEIRLTITAGHFGIFPEPELLLWLRAVAARPGKVLVVQPVESIDSKFERTRTFSAVELSIPSERIAALIGMLNSLGFPGRLPDIEDSGDPETIWWAGAALEVSMNGASQRLEFGFGRDGVRGRDSLAVREIFRTLFDCAGVRSRWSDLITGHSNRDD
jgi:hypothetical protein